MCDSSSDAPCSGSQPTIDPTKYERKRVPGMCVKCKVAKPNVTIRRSLYCKECFVRTCIVKFRTATNRSRKSTATPRTKLMVALSGGPSSSAMLSMMADFQRMHIKGTAAQPLYDDVVAGHVDESALFPEAKESLIADIAESAGVKFMSAKLEDVFADDGEASAFAKTIDEAAGVSQEVKDRIYARLVKSDANISSKERLKAFFAGLTTDTDREEMLDVLKSLLLVRLARKEGCGVLLMGDSGTRIATKIVSLASRGRGFSLPFEVGAESTWFSDVVVYRPMRDFIMKEIGFFNRWTAQKTVVVPTFTTAAPARASIGRLTEAFVVGLDQDFSSTVSTIGRTMQKLEPQKSARDALPCLLCGLPVEHNAQEWKSRLTVNRSSDAAALPCPSKSTDSTDRCSENNAQTAADVTRLLCYSCQGIVHSAAPDTVFPGANASSYHNSQEDLRRQIEMFFIDDDE
ncbi:Cytoplasmic tRNA 2-thiolation protein 2 [Coemansia sp. Benny D160-2]|nr:Cytoplasmic tRNA 2-thiolation protein 2 [Coemansia sp. Benny D160-2]